LYDSSKEGDLFSYNPCEFNTAATTPEILGDVNFQEK
jgi:hypothetical protein